MCTNSPPLNGNHFTNFITFEEWLKYIENLIIHNVLLNRIKEFMDFLLLVVSREITTLRRKQNNNGTYIVISFILKATNEFYRICFDAIRSDSNFFVIYTYIQQF